MFLNFNKISIVFQSLEKQHENVVFEKDELQEELAEITQINKVSRFILYTITFYSI